MRAFLHAGLLLAPLATALVLPPPVPDVDISQSSTIDSADKPQHLSHEDVVAASWQKSSKPHCKGPKSAATVVVDVAILDDSLESQDPITQLNFDLEVKDSEKICGQGNFFVNGALLAQTFVDDKAIGNGTMVVDEHELDASWVIECVIGLDDRPKFRFITFNIESVDQKPVGEESLGFTAQFQQQSERTRIMFAVPDTSLQAPNFKLERQLEIAYENREPTLEEVHDDLHFLKHQMRELKWQIREKKELIDQLTGQTRPSAITECDSIKCVCSALVHKVKGFASHVAGGERHGHHDHPHHRDGPHGRHGDHGRDHERGPGHHMKHNGSHPFPHPPKGNHSHPHPPYRRPHHHLPICRFPPPPHHGPPHHGPPPPHHGPPSYHGPPHHGPPSYHGPPHHGPPAHGPPPPPPHRGDGPDAHPPHHTPEHKEPDEHKRPSHDGPHEPHGPPHKDPQDHEGHPPPHHKPDGVNHHHGPSPFSNEHDHFDGPDSDRPHGPPPFILFLDALKLFAVTGVLFLLIRTVYTRCCCTKRSKEHRRQRREQRLRRKESRKQARKHAWREWALDLVRGIRTLDEEEQGDIEEKNAMLSRAGHASTRQESLDWEGEDSLIDQHARQHRDLIVQHASMPQICPPCWRTEDDYHYPSARASFDTQLPDYECDETMVTSLVGDGIAPRGDGPGSMGSVRGIIGDAKDGEMKT